MNDYEALKAYGHSPAKAAEIVLDAQRGDKHAIGWIAAIRGHSSAPSPEQANAADPQN